MAFLNELMINEMENPDILPDVIPKERGVRIKSLFLKIE